jgi:hypothetical protein
VDRSDTDRLKLLDLIADRVPELDLGHNDVEWTTLDDGHEALLGERRRDRRLVGCVVIRPDGSRELAYVEPDPLAQQAN